MILLLKCTCGYTSIDKKFLDSLGSEYFTCPKCEGKNITVVKKLKTKAELKRWSNEFYDGGSN